MTNLSIATERTKQNKRILNILLKDVTQKVRPSQRMIAFYNIVGKLPLRIGTFLLLLTSIDTIKIIVQAGIFGSTDAAIQMIYQYHFRPWRLLWAIGDLLWQGSYNCRSVRARGRFVQEAVKYLLGHLAQNTTSFNGSARKFTIVSLGSGSASQLLQGIKNNGLDIKNFKVVLVDHDSRALGVVRKNIYQLGLEGAIEFQQMIIGRFLRQVVTPASADFLEMVGLADYFKDIQLQRYMNEIYVALVPKGLFLGSNISSREEEIYAHRAARWPKMHYRSSIEIKGMLKKAGFREIWIKSCGLYTVWAAERSFSTR